MSTVPHSDHDRPSGEEKRAPDPGALHTPLSVMNGPAVDVRSMGCRLNLAEGEAITQMIARLNDEGGQDPADARDLIVINSCAVTNEAVRQTRQAIRRARRERPEARLVVTGCAAQIDPQSFAKMAEVDKVVGNREKLHLQTWRASSGERPGAGGAAIAVNDIMSVRETAMPFIEGYGERARAFLQIQTGCNHRCTFCIIPYGRGNARSVGVSAVIDQARRLIDHGHKEIVLTGVDITSWGEDLEGAPPLGKLVAALLDACPDLFRLRLSSIDGAEIDPLLMERLVSDPRMADHLHLSVQSGDNMILKRMKRRHTRDDIIALCSTLRAARPSMAFGADIIAGFPTETDDMFDNSRRLIDEAGLSFLHVFPFSPRNGTPAARMPQLDRALIKKRARILRDAGARAHHRFLDGLIGHVSDAVRETCGRVRLSNFADARLQADGDGDAAHGHADHGESAVVRVEITGRAGGGRAGDGLTARALAPGAGVPGGPRGNKPAFYGDHTRMANEKAGL